MQEQNKLARFEQCILPHLNAAYNLARWLTRNDQDAEDVVQEAYLRAFRFFDSFYGTDGHGWLLTIVRRTCYTWLQKNRPSGMAADFDEETQYIESDAPTPERQLLADADSRLLREALEELPLEFREALVLRELEGFSYKEIADIIGVPIGTVMSRLGRARKRLQQYLVRDSNRGVSA